MKLLKLINGSSRGERRAQRRQMVPRVDALEGRELKTAGISLIAGTVDIQGSTGANSVFVAYTDASHSVIAVTSNGTTADFNRGAVTGIDFQGQNGSYDSLYNLTDISSAAKGGNGLNVFYGGTGNNNFVGGNGTNLFWGNGAHDTLTGGNGTNIFFAGSGQVALTGGNGSNIFYGVTTNDTVTVGSGFNFIQRR